MNEDLYEHIWRLYYRCYFQELSSYALSKRYAAWDIGTSMLLLLTIFGSLGLGVAFWNDPEWRQYWITISAAASIVALGNLTFSVSSSRQDHVSFFREFSQLRTDIESFMDGMKSGLIKDLDKIAEKAGQFDKRFRSIKSKTTFDFIIFTKRFRAKIQNELDDILERSGYNLAGGNR